MGAVIYSGPWADATHLENVAADVAISLPMQGVTISGAGTVDFYPCAEFLGMTVTASTGLALHIAISNDEAARMIDWLHGNRP